MHTCPSAHIGRCLNLLADAANVLSDIPPTPCSLETSCSRGSTTECSLEIACGSGLQSPTEGFGGAQWQAFQQWYEDPCFQIPNFACFASDPFRETIVSQALASTAVPGVRTLLSLSAVLDHGNPQAMDPATALGCNQQQHQAHIFETLPHHAAPIIESTSTSRPPVGPAPGSPELPSIGSIGHESGRCKPCAFLHTKGCENGLACQFCHLCPAEAKKERRQEKLQQRREAQRARNQRRQQPTVQRSSTI